MGRASCRAGAGAIKTAAAVLKVPWARWQHKLLLIPEVFAVHRAKRGGVGRARFVAEPRLQHGMEVVPPVYFDLQARARCASPSGLAHLADPIELGRTHLGAAGTAEKRATLDMEPRRLVDRSDQARGNLVWSGRLESCQGSDRKSSISNWLQNI